MIKMPEHAMVLAAGRGERMRPLTDSIPKPLLKIKGESFLSRILDKLHTAGVSKAVVNMHHLGAQIEMHLKDRTQPHITLSDENDALLETGGGVRRALPLLGTAPFFTLNGDAFWIDGAIPMLQRMVQFFDPDKMDVLLLLCPLANIIGSKNKGDYFCDADGRLRWRQDADAAPYMFASCTITHPRLYIDAPDKAFSQKLLWDKAEKAGRLYGLIHDAEWLHVSTPDNLKAVDQFLDTHSA